MVEFKKIPFDIRQMAWKFLTKPNGGFGSEEILRAEVQCRSDRQALFEENLLQLARYFGPTEIPVFLNTPSCGDVQLDKGCIGHSIANNILEFPRNNIHGKVEKLVLRNAGAGLS